MSDIYSILSQFETLRMAVELSETKTLASSDFQVARDAAIKLASKIGIMEDTQRMEILQTFSKLFLNPQRRAIGFAGLMKTIEVIDGESDALKLELLKQLKSMFDQQLNREMDDIVSQMLISMTNLLHSKFQNLMDLILNDLSKVWITIDEKFLCTWYQIGIGTTASVYKGFSSTGQRVAIKIVDTSNPRTSRLEQFLNREIEVVNRIGFHPNVISYLSTKLISKRYYFVMEYCDFTLEEYICKLPDGKLTESQAFPLIQQLLLGLIHLHEHEIIHRDLKPSNILLAKIPGSTLNPNSTTVFNSPSRYQLKIADLNLSRLLPEQDLSSTFVGTPLVMAPEQLKGQAYNHSVDVYSAGVVIYYMVTGNFPYQNAMTNRALLEMQQNTHISTLMDRKLMTEPLCRLLCEMMEFDPEQRTTLNQLGAHPFLKLYDIPVDFGGFDLRQVMRLQKQKMEHVEIDNRVLKVQLANASSKQLITEMKLETVEQQLLQANQTIEQIRKQMEQSNKEKIELSARLSDLLKRETGLQTELSALMERHALLHKQNTAMDGEIQNLYEIIRQLSLESTH